MFKSSARLVDIPNSGLNNQIFLIFFQIQEELVTLNR